MKTALVIGAGSGIGQGIADIMDEMDVTVVRADISFPLEREDKTIRHLDATDNRSIHRLTDFLSGESINIDYLIITIGAIDEGQVTDYPEQSLSWMLDINILTSYRLVQHLIPFLRNSSKVLLTGSAAGLGSFGDTYNLMPYIVSKHGLMGYFKVLRQELANEGIQVSLLLPNRVKGKLSENSTTMRALFLDEKGASTKGAQQSNIDLVAPLDVAKEFIESFLAGKTYISNNPQMIIDKLQAELTEIRKDLLDE